MWARPDLSNQLIHFTRGTEESSASEVLSKILREQRLMAGTGFIKGGYSCVCFTEAPIHFLAESCRSVRWLNRYSPYGVMFDKCFIFGQGGRPVVYQSAGEFADLAEAKRWKHVRYEPVQEIDFTWEREWRLPCDLSFTPNQATVVVPTKKNIALLAAHYEDEQDSWVQQLSNVIGESAESMRAVFPWGSLTLFE